MQLRAHLGPALEEEELGHRHPEHRHPEQLTHSASRPRLAPTGLFRDRYFQNSQGLWIFKRMWRPTVAPVGTVFIVHGYGEVVGRDANPGDPRLM